MDHVATSELRAADRIRAVGEPSRLVLAVVLVAATPLINGVTRDDQIRFGLIVAFAWIPVAGVWSALARRRPSRAADLGSMVIDLSLLVIVLVALHPSAVVLVLGHLLIVAYYTYLDGRWMSAIIGLAGFGIVWAAGASHGAPEFDWYVVAFYPFVLVCLAWLLDAAAIEWSVQSARVLRLNEKSDAILTGVAEAVMVTSPSGRIREWNRAAEQTFTCAHADAVGRPCDDVLALRRDVRDLDCTNGCAVLAMQTETDGTSTVDVEVWRTAATGQRQPLLATAMPVVDGSGEVVEVVHSFRDVTKLKQADEAKTLFLATASHELKTPLTVIRGFSQMLLLPDNTMTDEERLTALRAIDLRAGQLTGIVDRLLLSSRIEAGTIDLAPEATDVRESVQEQVASTSAATARMIDLEMPDDLPDLWIDPAAFTTVLDHLLDNAVKYSPGGGPITVVLRAADDDVAELLVTDEGVGMTDEQAARCFERFWQAELTDVRRFGGTGIGLYIVRSLVDAMHGTVAVESAPGQGSTFRVTLPRADHIEITLPGDDVERPAGRGDKSIIREYMRQLGVRLESP